MKKILIRILILGAIIALIAFVPPLGAFLMTLFVPPRIFYVIGFIIIIILLKILYELRGKRDK